MKMTHCVIGLIGFNLVVLTGLNTQKTSYLMLADMVAQLLTEPAIFIGVVPAQ